MSNRSVDVFDQDGAKLFTYAISLEEDSCLDEEFEEVALILAERSGLVAIEDVPRLMARCEGADTVRHPVASAKPVRAKGNVLSMVKHRMKKAATASAVRSKRHA